MDNCIFCKIIKGEIPDKRIYEDDKVIALLDLHPACDGHTLIIPKKHITDMIEMDNDTLTHIYEVAKKLTPTLMEKTNAKGLSLRINYGDSQEVKHFHMHVLPNYQFKKASMTQDEAYELLKDAIK